MPRLQFRNPGQYGVIYDIPPHDLPPEAWSFAKNVKFRDGRAFKARGHTASFATELEATNKGVHFILPLFQDSGEFSWVIASLTDVWTLAPSALDEITNVGGDYTGTASDRWNGTVLADVIILNNGVDPPQEKTSSASDLTDLTYVSGTSTWANTDGTSGGAGSGLTCKVMRSFRDFLVALYVTDNNTGVTNPFRVQWSSRASAGSVPTSWDYSDDSVAAGFYDIVETPDWLVDCLTLRDINIVYKENSIWSMRYVGSARGFEFYKISGEHGMLAQQCAVEFKNQHCVKTLDDLIIHNGQQVTERILDQRWRRFLQNDIDPDNYLNSFMIANHRDYEIWFCYPETTLTYCSKALIWNYQHNTLSIRDLPNIVHAATGVVRVDISDGVDSQGNQTANQLNGPYDIRYYDPVAKAIMMTQFQDGSTDAVLYKPDVTAQFDTVNYTSQIQRIGIPLTDAKANRRTSKIIKSVIPYIFASENDELEIRIGTQVHRNDTPTWSDWQTYTVGTTRELHFNELNAGYYLSFDMRSTGDILWEFDGFDVEYEERGELSI